MPHAGRAAAVRVSALPTCSCHQPASGLTTTEQGPERDERPFFIQYTSESGSPFGQTQLFLPTRRSAGNCALASAGRGHSEQWCFG